jgi:hypothetical protein
MAILPLAICWPDQCCPDGYCIDEIHLHSVDRATAEEVAKAVGRLVDAALHEPQHTGRPPHPNTMAGR